MAEENLKLKLLKLKDTGRSDVLKSALKRLTADKREKGTLDTKKERSRKHYKKHEGIRGRD